MKQGQHNEQHEIDSLVINSLDQFVEGQSIDVQQELNHRRMTALTAKKPKAMRTILAIAAATSFVWFGSNIANKQYLDVQQDDVIIVDIAIEEAPMVELEVLEHTDFLLWLSEQEDDTPHG